MKDYETFVPLEIVGAEGSYLHTAEGTRIIDAISSWWCKSLGHGHPKIREALKNQAEKFEHIIFANTVQKNAVLLGEKLSQLSPPLDRVFLSSEGSTAVEVALKMAVQAQALKGAPQRTHFIALENGYHGESVSALAVSDLGLYKEPFVSLAPQATILKGLPYVESRHSPLWKDCSAYWPQIEAQLEAVKSKTAAVILEPVLQGAGGMLLYSPDLIKCLRKWTQENDVFLIADEIMTGFGRTGKELSLHHSEVIPDFICLSKGLTAGWLPLSAVLTSTSIYQLFYGDYQSGRSFLHSNTFSGNALAVAVALAALESYETENIYTKVTGEQEELLEMFKQVAEETGCLQSVRGLGAVVAGDLIVPKGWKDKRLGYAVFQEAVKRGAWLRPLGNTIYWMLPLNVEKDTIKQLQRITMESIQSVLGKRG